MNIEQRLEELNIKLPTLPDGKNPIEPGIRVDNIVHLSGKTPMVDGEMKYTGIVDSTVSTEQAQEAAKICLLNLLSSLKKVIGDLNKVKRVIKLNGYVASESKFTGHAKVINAASTLLNEIFGEDKKHARVAMGIASLPNGAPVEIEMIVEVDE